MAAAAKLQERLILAGLRQTDLAKRLRIDSSVVHLWCTGKRTIPAYRVPEIASVLHEDADDLAGAIAVTPPPPPPIQVMPGEELWPKVWRVPGPLSADEVVQERLRKAGMLRLEDAERRYEVVCFSCARGTGPAGVLQVVPCIPEHVAPCRACGSRMFVRELPSAGAERLLGIARSRFDDDDEEAVA